MKCPPTSAEPTAPTSGRSGRGRRGAPDRPTRAAPDGPAVGGEHVTERLAVPQLLVDPAPQERGDLGVGVGRGHEQVAEVADRVQLDVVHVLDAPQRVVVERRRAEGVEVDVSSEPLGWAL